MQALPDAGGGEEEKWLRETFQHSARLRTSASGSEDKNLPSSMNYQHIYILMRSPRQQMLDHVLPRRSLHTALECMSTGDKNVFRRGRASVCV